MALVVLEDIIKKKMRDVSDADQAKMCKAIGKLKVINEVFYLQVMFAMIGY